MLLVDDEQIERMALAKKIDRYYGDKVEIYHAVNGRDIKRDSVSSGERTRKRANRE